MTDAVAFPDTFDEQVGLVITERRAAEGQIAGRVAVRPQILQPFGLVHGGVYASVAESLASIGTFDAVGADGRVGVGSSNHTTFLRPITAGMIHASAVARHRGRTTWVWDVECRDDDGRVCAISRVTIAVRAAPAPSA